MEIKRYFLKNKNKVVIKSSINIITWEVLGTLSLTLILSLDKISESHKLEGSLI